MEGSIRLTSRSDRSKGLNLVVNHDYDFDDVDDDIESE
jgi:hypothetical protein